MGSRLRGLWLALLVLLLGVSSGAGAGACPPGLEEAARSYRLTLEREQEKIRGSSLASPAGIEETVQFDLASHACHRGPGQAYRVFGMPECLPAGAGGAVPVRYAYELYFRKALTLEELFQQPWQPGSDGIVQVEFEAEGERWVPVGRRELLDTRAGPGHPGMAPSGPPEPAPQGARP